MPSAADVKPVKRVPAMRADARRNRDQILRAAQEVFAAKGVTVSTEEVAASANVSIGTVFRHFPTKQALLEAMLLDRLAQLTAITDALSQHKDAGHAFFSLLTLIIDGARTSLAFSDTLLQVGVDVHKYPPQLWKGLKHRIATLLERAQRAGAVRSDLKMKELILLIVGISRATQHHSWNAKSQTKVLQILFDGLRPAHG
jgi:AcrR family transcriptional regulator